MSETTNLSNQEVAEIAAAHGIRVQADQIGFTEIGLDFRVGFATAQDGTRWVLRLPRRADVMARARIEARALALIGPQLPVAVPDWRVFAEDLIAYPMLPGEPGLTFDPETYEVTWHFDRNSPLYPRTLGAAIAALHAIEPETARAADLPVFTPAALRQKWRDDLARVAAEFDVAPGLLTELRGWVEDESYWPDVCTLIHGDLYAGHVMVETDGRATGIIDWTEARVADPAVDLAGHVRAFGEDALPALIEAYAAAGGRTWPRMAEHCVKLTRASAVTYGIYALETGDAGHRAAAQAQLGAA
ncbi:phosphotransferase [Chelativorans sp. ZYF759]|uniref:macrolide 2'-phosphotransferase n=1 Tax=Chelativorans sp. ZYF759 TaxID=2692213 RepID=UPI00145F224E|nr:macrolide 2'-phosphotransferase [Chelativorans sp. ZYF759]NMG38833.1 phosphotransferase [Chelativorans sp. ZYF759]